MDKQKGILHRCTEMLNRIKVCMIMWSASYCLNKKINLVFRLLKFLWNIHGE